VENAAGTGKRKGVICEHARACTGEQGTSWSARIPSIKRTDAPRKQPDAGEANGIGVLVLGRVWLCEMHIPKA
jgi:hypothetical protein